MGDGGTESILFCARARTLSDAFFLRRSWHWYLFFVPGEWRKYAEVFDHLQRGHEDWITGQLLARMFFLRAPPYWRERETGGRRKWGVTKSIERVWPFIKFFFSPFRSLRSKIGAHFLFPSVWWGGKEFWRCGSSPLQKCGRKTKASRKIVLFIIV